MGLVAGLFSRCFEKKSQRPLGARTFCQGVPVAIVSRWQQFGHAGNVVGFMGKGENLPDRFNAIRNLALISQPKACHDSNVMAFTWLQRPLGFTGFLSTILVCLGPWASVDYWKGSVAGLGPDLFDFIDRIAFQCCKPLKD